MNFLEKLQNLFSKTTESIQSSNQKVKNPIAKIISQYSRSPDINLPSAKLGFALKIIFADNVVSDEEKKMLQELIEIYFPELKSSSLEITNQLLQIKEYDLEMLYFAQELKENLSEEQRQEFLLDLFKIAKVDNFAIEEESVIRIICKHLFINHSTFIKLRNQK